jgi:exonuclease III
MCRSGNSNVSVDPDPHPPIQASEDTLSICSFNIMWLGSYKKKDELALASLLQNYDIVVIQELVAPPFDGTYPDETEFESDTEALEFFNAMENVGFSHVLSEEDTGPNSEIHSISSTTEWWVCFYNDDKVDIAGDLPIGFLETDRSANPNYKRVPYAFGFRKDELDVVLISVHLAPGDDDEDTQFRAHEFQSIFSWIDSHNDTEKDFIVLGDMNIENLEELNNITPSGYLSLNDECRKTNTAAGTDKPYDHVIYNISNTANEIDIEYDLEVIDLVEAMRDRWESGEPYPGDPYDHNLFKQYYSDHNPVVFRMVIPANDDD